MRESMVNNQNNNTVSPVFNIHTNPQTTTVPPKVDFEMGKKLKTLEKQEENRTVKNGKNAFYIFLASLSITFGSLYVYVNEWGHFD